MNTLEVSFILNESPLTGAAFRKLSKKLHDKMQGDNIEHKLPLEHSIPLSEPHFLQQFQI